MEIQKNYTNKFKISIISPINQEYSWGKYGEFNIAICLKNGYINGSVLLEECFNFEENLRKKHNYKSVSKNKHITNWLSNDNTQMLVETVSEKLNIKKSDLMFDNNNKQKKGEEVLKGIFIHPIFIDSIIEWVSPSFALLNTTIEKKVININCFSKIFEQMKESIDKQKKMLEENDILVEKNKQIMINIDNIKKRMKK